MFGVSVCSTSTRASKWMKRKMCDYSFCSTSTCASKEMKENMLDSYVYSTSTCASRWMKDKMHVSCCNPGTCSSMWA